MEPAANDAEEATAVSTLWTPSRSWASASCTVLSTCAGEVVTSSDKMEHKVARFWALRRWLGTAAACCILNTVSMS
jgi:hypothetical protein